MIITRIIATTVVLALRWGSAGLVAEEPVRTPPVPLLTPRMYTPIEAAGTGLAPEVTVRLVVYKRGTPTDVKVELIDPPSELDEVFTKRTASRSSRS